MEQVAKERKEKGIEPQCSEARVKYTSKGRARSTRQRGAREVHVKGARAKCMSKGEKNRFSRSVWDDPGVVS